MHHRARRTKTEGLDGASVVTRWVALAHWGCAKVGFAGSWQIGNPEWEGT